MWLKNKWNKQQEIDRIESEAEKEYRKKLEDKEVKDYHNHQMMLQDTHISNKNTIDFKQRIKLIQKKEKDQQQLTERRRDENELQVIKIKQKMDKAQNKFRYYEDLNQQTVLKRLKDNNNKQLSKNEMSLNKEIIDYSKRAGVNALIPGINNWNTVGSVPLKRGIEYTKQIQPLLISSSITQAKLDPPKITSARNSKYEKLKELENEYFNLGNGSAAGNKYYLL